jgi:hypothetical protein
MKNKLNSSNSISLRHTRFNNVLDNMFSKITSNQTTGAELNILKKDINKTTSQVEEEVHKVLPNGGLFRKEFLKKEMSMSLQRKETIMVSLAEDVISKLKIKQSKKSIIRSPKKSIQYDSIKQISASTHKNSLESTLEKTAFESPIKKPFTHLPSISEGLPSPQKQSINNRRSSILSQIVQQHRLSGLNSITSSPDRKSEMMNLRNAFNNITKDIKEVIKMPRMSINYPLPNFKDESHVNEYLMREHGIGQANINISNRNHELMEKYIKDKNEKKIKEMEEEDEKFYEEKFGHAKLNTIETNGDIEEDLKKLKQIKKVYINKIRSE